MGGVVGGVIALQINLFCTNIYGWSRDAESRQMPKKVPLRVIYCTGWEDDYPPKDLEVREETEH